MIAVIVIVIVIIIVIVIVVDDYPPRQVPQHMKQSKDHEQAVYRVI